MSSRSLYIDGEIPFEEVSVISFDYDNDWNLMTLSDEEGTPYDFYLEKGKHKIRLEATLGDMGTILEELEDSTYRLNQIYRKFWYIQELIRMIIVIIIWTRYIRK